MEKFEAGPNFGDQKNIDYRIKPINKNEVDLTMSFNDSEESPLNIVAENEFDAKLSIKDAEKYRSVYSKLEQIRESLKKEIEKEKDSKRCFELYRDLDDLNEAILAIENIGTRKEEVVNKTDEKNKKIINSN